MQIFLLIFIRGLRSPHGKGLVGHCTSGHSLSPPLQQTNVRRTHARDHVDLLTADLTPSEQADEGVVTAGQWSLIDHTQLLLSDQATTSTQQLPVLDVAARQCKKYAQRSDY